MKLVLPNCRAAVLAVCGLLAAARVVALGLPQPSLSTVPCSIVLVGHHNGVADPYGEFIVVVRNSSLSPIPGATVTVDFSPCCPGIRLSNTQLSVGVSHAENSAIVTAVTDATGTARFRIEGAAAGALSSLVSPSGCALITSALSGGLPVLLTDDVYHPTVVVATPDLGGVMGGAGVEITELATFLADKNAYAMTTANYRQRSDLDFHLPTFNCWETFNPVIGHGDNLGDLTQWISIKNATGSSSNGPFPVNCP